MPVFRKVLPAIVAAVMLLLWSAPVSAKPKKNRRAKAAKRIYWKVTETGPETATATWIWDAKKKRFFGRWSNGAAGYVRVEKLEQKQIVLTRIDPRGARTGLTARYEGTITGPHVSGTVEYTYAGRVTHGTWQATHYGKAKATARKRPLNKRRYRGQRRVLLSKGERRSFPRLKTNFEVLAPRTKVYNCIAWSIGVTNRWVWPGDTISAFDQLYGMYGYRRISTQDYRAEPGVQKIVLYAHVYKNGRIKCTHGARQMPDGTWTSKLGKLPLIRHMSPKVLSGPSYGRPVAVYVKS